MTDGTLLYRQIHPGFVRDGRATSQAFKPTPKDRKRLSVYDGDRITAEESWRHYARRYPSVGVLAVSVAECEPLPVRPDPQPFPEHVVIDFTELSRTAKNRKAKRLRRAANERGWQYRPAN